ncbi:Leucine-rich repeat-containing protein 31 [Collichthys lucidus]|uniref:Leucine-rich repeat-containing protein 31 n=1 Tax=Collichthys lucidus TaxID=240159 RepID=A0A4U5VHY3_COLLU|nr:Leucine-rich repeat-containing protein 31 [Collichthys lucidus]
MNQIRRKRTASDRKPLGRLLSWTSDRTGIPEDGEAEGKEERGPGSGAAEAAESGQDVGWGRVSLFLQRLGKKADSSRLSLAHCDLTATDLLELATLLQFLPQLEEVDVSWNELIGGSLTALTSHLQHVAGIRALRLCSCRLSADDIAALGGVVSALPRLCVLDVSCNPQLTQEVDVGGFTALASSLSHAASVTTLRFHACGLTPDGLDALVVGGRLALLLDALQPSVILELRLSSCELTTDDLRHLAAVCRRGCLSSLRVLDLSYNGSVGDAGWSSLFSAGGLSSLQDVDLSLRPSTSAPCSAWLPPLLSALPRLPALTRLAARRWTVGSQDRKKLSHCLKKRSVLLEWDPPQRDAGLLFKATNQESPEESRPEE